VYLKKKKSSKFFFMQELQNEKVFVEAKAEQLAGYIGV